MADTCIRAIRGAITVEENSPEAISEATKELLRQIVEQNALQPEDIISVIFTATKDLNAAYPAKAAREIGWSFIPLMCMQEMDVPGSLPYCIRVLLHVNTTKSRQEIKHIYLREAKNLRPDLTKT